MKHFFVYVLLCSDGSYYTGHTDDIEKRIPQHNNGEGGFYTSHRLPIQLVFLQEFNGRDEALIAELKVKKWSTAKKKALIKSDWNLIHKLSKKNFKK